MLPNAETRLKASIPGFLFLTNSPYSSATLSIHYSASLSFSTLLFIFPARITSLPFILHTRIASLPFILHTRITSLPFILHTRITSLPFILHTRITSLPFILHTRITSQQELKKRQPYIMAFERVSAIGSHDIGLSFF